jgi:uncharacterized membrane protein
MTLACPSISRFAPRPADDDAPCELVRSSALPNADAAEERIIALMIAVAAALYFLGSWFRYNTFRAGALDLGVWDQAMYLISVGQSPHSTILGIHMLADHASFALYFIAQLYRIFPTVIWLFLIQAGSIAGAAWPLWRLAREAGIRRPMARAIVIAYLLYPVVATAALGDFYPESLAVPALLSAILCAQRRRPIRFVFWVLVGLSTKEAMAITFAATALYLATLDRRRAYALAALSLSLIWYVTATQFVIPHFGHGDQPSSLRYFSYLGATQGQMIRTILLKPWIPIARLASRQAIIYLAAIFAPVIWGLSRRSLIPLLCAAPCLALNLISAKPEFRNPFLHYSWPAIPLIFLAVIATVAQHDGWFTRGRSVAIWSVALALIGLAARGYEAKTRQTSGAATVEEKRRAVEMIDDRGGVLATSQTAPHLSERTVIQFVYDRSDPVFRLPPDGQIDWVLLDLGEESVRNAGSFGTEILQKYESTPDFRAVYHSGALYLFHRTATVAAK